MPSVHAKRPDPEQLLRQVQAEEQYEKRGRLKVFLGYTSGVGKSFRMFDEGRRRRERGQDVVVGAVQMKASEDVQQLLDRLEAIPLLDCNGVGVMDVNRILARHPGVCLVDGLAYDNPPGCLSPKRWQDVERLLERGISVITTINLQYIEEFSTRVAEITGKRAGQTVPVSFIHTADEIAIVDAPPELPLNRGDEQDGSGIARPLSQEQLSELREMALLLAADVVERQLSSYLNRSGIEASWGTQERILVCLTPRANASRMIESGRRNAERFHGELFAVYVTQGETAPEDVEVMERNFEIARHAGAKVEVLEGVDPVDCILSFARTHGITQIFIGHSRQSGWWTRLTGTPVDRLLDRAEDMDVRVFPQ
jgi:two-component system sensor histidine kinase KdpD